MISLPTKEGIRRNIQDHAAAEMAIFLRLIDKRREHTHSPFRSQAVHRWVAGVSQCGDRLISRLGRTPGACLRGTGRNTAVARLIGLEAAHRICYPLPRSLSSTEMRHAHASCCSNRVCWRGTRRCPRPGLSANPSRPCSRNRCTHL